MNSTNQYKIMALYKISQSIKQPCGSVCLNKAIEMYHSY